MDPASPRIYVRPSQASPGVFSHLLEGAGIPNCSLGLLQGRDLPAHNRNSTGQGRAPGSVPPGIVFHSGWDLGWHPEHQAGNQSWDLFLSSGWHFLQPAAPGMSLTLGMKGTFGPCPLPVLAVHFSQLTQHISHSINLWSK